MSVYLSVPTANPGGREVHEDGHLVALSSVENTGQAMQVFDVRVGFDSTVFQGEGDEYALS